MITGHISPEVLRLVAVVVAATYTTVVKVINLRLERKREKKEQEKSSKKAVTIDEALKRIKQFDEIIDVPEDANIPQELLQIVLERNYFKLMADHYRRQLHGNVDPPMPSLKDPFNELTEDEKEIAAVPEIPIELNDVNEVIDQAAKLEIKIK